jgi:hypothetical protein
MAGSFSEVPKRLTLLKAGNKEKSGPSGYMGGFLLVKLNEGSWIAVLLRRFGVHARRLSRIKTRTPMVVL